MDNETLQYILTYIDKKFETLMKRMGDHTSLPIASKQGFGGIVVGDRLTIDANTGKLSADTQTPSAVTTSANGLMTSADKIKLNSMEDMTIQDANEAFNAIFSGYTMGGGE